MSAEIHQARGNLHTGSGNQWNLTLHTAKVAVRRGAGAWSESTFEHVNQCFFEPDGFQEIQAAIEEHKVVILKGIPGSGRRFAALKLLSKSQYSPGLFYAPVVGSGDDESLSGLRIQRGDRVLVDLSTMDEAQFKMVAPEVQPFVETVQTARARSVIILPDACEPEPDWLKIVRPITRPDPVKAYRRHLKSIGVLADAIDGPAVHEHFRHAPMADLTRLMLLVVEARDANPTLDDRAWTRVALEALRAGPKEVAAILKELKAGQQRALLLASSLFAGGSADGAWHAARVLLETLRYPKDPDLPLDRSDLQEQLALFGAGIDQHRHIQFHKPLDAAIRAYMWDGYPALRNTLAEWIKALGKNWKWSLADAERVAARFGEQHLRTRQITSMAKLIADLAGSEADEPIRQAFVLLELGLKHPDHGRGFRRQMWEWAKNPPSDGLGEVLIRACVEVIGDTHPDQALVRLHHLARRSGRIGEMACETLAVQLAQDRLLRLIRLLLFRMVEHPNDRDPAIFVHVIDPHLLIDWRGRARPLAAEPAVRTQLALAWRATLAKQPRGWQEQLDSWLIAAANRSGSELLLAILAEAPDDLAARSRLHAAAVAWAAARGGAWSVADALLERVNDAQGFSFVAMEGTD
ncbi:conserved hypothetical protein [Catenulispora acidiphila DSM 44928]|uniref:Uncharacterized protein n=1 Tax=Catenulispora acidiphila (strain DSM 44928 / JCM 14897 / NBRC 102108 / NRRL B-24433 / ID139908) TaxID=479433 RepID=C7QB61_CATAD|nr:hypothetical protein [Catenulispora acidiphila]ACU76352.1 conserved hypothetical protein [Catenulispora acidiphila DSM 44928]